MYSSRFKNSQVKVTFTHKVSVALFSVPLFLSTPVMAGVTAFVERFEAVAKDAAIPGWGTVDNSWGMHQPRITRHADGSIRILYVSRDAQGNVAWNVMHRSSAGQWSKEASGPTNDDVALMRDATNDRAHILAWPASVPTLFTSPTFTEAVVPGAWQMMGPTSRHYGNAGIGRDGTVCLKASREFSILPLTSVSNTEYACGTFSDTSRAWNWSDVVVQPVGARHAYDYIFPNPEGLASGMYATSSRDLYKTAADVPNLDPIYGNYVFNGLRFYATALNTSATWLKTDTKVTPYISPETQAATGAMVTTPIQRLHESFIDSKGRVFSGYFADDPTNSASVRGLYLMVNNTSGYNLFQGKWATLPTYGYTRIFEDSKNRLWLLWTNQGSQLTQVRLYPVIESTVSGRLSFTLGNFTDLSAAFKPYSIQGNLYIAVPRGGNDRTLYVDAIYNTCWTTYQPNVGFNSSQCYNSDRSGFQRVFYTRIRLPD